LIRDAVADSVAAAGGRSGGDFFDKDSVARSILSGLPQFPALEAFHRQREMLASSPHNFLSAAAAAGLRTPPSLVSRMENSKADRPVLHIGSSLSRFRFLLPASHFLPCRRPHLLPRPPFVPLRSLRRPRLWETEAGVRCKTASPRNKTGASRNSSNR
jgi:hypothetical protein